jgi:hypothetical protein
MERAETPRVTQETIEGFWMQVVGNVDSRRTEVEIYPAGTAAHTDPVAVVYDSRDGWIVRNASGTASPTIAIPPSVIKRAEERLKDYVNRRGENPPVGLTRPGLSLWLTEKSDGTAMGVKVR